MNEAISLFFNFWNQVINWFFNNTIIEGSSVTLGWVLISIWLFGLIIRNILNVPRASRSVHLGKETFKKGD